MTQKDDVFAYMREKNYAALESELKELQAYLQSDAACFGKFELAQEQALIAELELRDRTMEEGWARQNRLMAELDLRNEGMEGKISK